MFYKEEWFFSISFLIGIVIIFVVFLRKRKRFSSEVRSETKNLLGKSNSTNKLFWFVLIMLFVANFVFDEIYGYEKIARAVIHIPIWCLLVFLVLKNRRTLTNADFPQELIKFDFYFGLLVVIWWGIFMILAFLFY